MLVSALSQLWVFGLYEILRTWKQRISELIRYGEQLSILRARSREAAEAFIHQKRDELKARLPEDDQSIVDAFQEIEADEGFLAIYVTPGNA
jgi:hypothetical protein